MKIIKLNAIDSTNTYLKNLSKNVVLDDSIVVLTGHQTEGRGQMGAKWQSKTGQSLTFSVFKRFKDLSIQEQSMITFAVSLGIKNGLEGLGIPALHIKWPNDIMSYGKKLCGILIENQLEGEKLATSIIGIGVNVNETEFIDLPQATSMRLSTGQLYELDEVFQLIVKEVLNQLEAIEKDNFSNLKKTYEASLFRINMVSSFQQPDGTIFNGIIKGVSDSGELIIQDENDKLLNFELKQLKLLN